MRSEAPRARGRRLVTLSPGCVRHDLDQGSWHLVSGWAAEPVEHGAERDPVGATFAKHVGDGSAQALWRRADLAQ